MMGNLQIKNKGECYKNTMKKIEKKHYASVISGIGIVFIIGILIGNIIVSLIQEKEFSIETTSQCEESVMYLKKPQFAKNFLYYNEMLLTRNGIVSETEQDAETNEKTTCSSEEDVGSIDEPTFESAEESKSEKPEKDTTAETTKKIETSEHITDEHTTDDGSTNTDKTTETPIEEDTTVIETTQEETTKKTPIIKADHYACSLDEIYYTYPVRTYTAEQKELIAKMLYCEARGCSWDGQVATCSAIINHIEHNNGDFSVLDKGNHFSPASFYRYKTPNQMQYDVLEFVLSGHLIADVKYFRMNYYHNFGTPMFAIDGEYFSK